MSMIKGRVETEREFVVRKIISGKAPHGMRWSRPYTFGELKAAFARIASDQLPPPLESVRERIRF